MKLTRQTIRVSTPTGVDIIQLGANFFRLALAMGAMLALAPIAVSAQTTSGNAANGAVLWAANGCAGGSCHALSGDFVGTNTQIINARNAGGIGANATGAGMGGFNAASFTPAQENDLAAYIATITAPLATQTATYQTTKAFIASDVVLNTTYSALTSTVIVTQPLKGTASVPSGRTLNYVPAAGRCGTDSFTYKAQNASRSTSDRTANITITGDPANNSFSGRIGLGTTSSVATSGHNCGATFEPLEPTHAATGNSSVWWTWTAPRSGPVSIDTFGSNFDTLLGIYTGASVSALTLIGSNDQAGGNQCQQKHA